jgi:hypothetical protein
MQNHFETSSTTMARQEENIRRTRSGRPINGSYRTDSLQAPKTRQARSRSKSPVRKQPKKPKTTVALQGPLSELTEHMKDVHLKDLEVWVHRSAEDRRKEARARKGYITRPMNAFILYRSAYADRTKAWCSENNHQVVSKVCGASWALEDEKIKTYYKNLYEIEKENHALAFPEYKFSPAKTQTKKKRKSEEMDDDSDGDWGQTNTVRRRHREGRDASYPARSVPPVTDDHEQYVQSHDWNYPATRVWQLPQQHAEISQYAPPQIMPYYDNNINHALSQEQLMQNLYNNSLLGIPMTSYPELSYLRSNATTPAAAVDPSLPASYGLTRQALRDHQNSYSLPYPNLPTPVRTTPVIASQHIEPSKQIPVYMNEPPHPLPRAHALMHADQSLEAHERRDSWGAQLDHIPGLEHQGEFESYMSEPHGRDAYLGHPQELADGKDSGGEYAPLESGLNGLLKVDRDNDEDG